MNSLNKRYEIARLIAGERAGTLDEEGQRRLEEWLEENVKHREEHERISRRLDRELETGIPPVDSEEEWARFTRRVAARRAVRAWRRVAAAVVVACLVTGAWYFSREVPGADPVVPGIVKRHTATLVLGSGERVLIPENASGVIPTGGEAEVVTLENRLQYGESVGTSERTVYHTVMVPHGGEYELQLADGTRVWLNSGSRVTFPARFDGETREVRMEGEVCFEVERDESRPFVVHAGEVSLEVLGTLFNVEAYPGESLVATLVEGSLRVAAGEEDRLLRPGEQATVEDGRVTTRVVRARESVMWIRGIFNFTETSLETIMTRLARWYDVEVTYRDESARAARFTLEIKRYENIANVLSKIEMTGRVHFTIEGNRVFVGE
jgi:ferric-dicitrate binding protein FerR (iron transport regulator)